MFAFTVFIRQFQLSLARQSVTLLKQDKEFLSKQLNNTELKLTYADERIAQLNEQLDHTKASREELYEKYVASRCVATQPLSLRMSQWDPPLLAVRLSPKLV